MSTPPEILSQIRHGFLQAGLGAAVELTRAAFESGQIDPRDIADIFLALRSGSWRHFEEPGRLPRHSATDAARAA